MSLVHTFLSRWMTNSYFDLRLLLLLMTIIFSFTRFILQMHVIVLSVHISFLRICLFTVKNNFSFNWFILHRHVIA